MHHDLATRFDYDAVFGTVLNRFCVQAVVGHPLTVYGKGGQTRGMLDIRDTLACVELALSTPPTGRVPGLQPVHRVLQRLEHGRDGGRRLPRHGHDRAHGRPPGGEGRALLPRRHTKLLDLGLVPHLLTKETLQSMLAMVERFKDRVDANAFKATVNWRHATNSPPDVGFAAPEVSRPGRARGGAPGSSPH